MVDIEAPAELVQALEGIYKNLGIRKNHLVSARNQTEYHRARNHFHWEAMKLLEAKGIRGIKTVVSPINTAHTIDIDYQLTPPVPLVLAGREASIWLGESPYTVFDPAVTAVHNFGVIGDGYEIIAKLDDDTLTAVLSVRRNGTPEDWRGLHLTLDKLRKSEKLLVFIDESLP